MEHNRRIPRSNDATQKELKGGQQNRADGCGAGVQDATQKELKVNKHKDVDVPRPFRMQLRKN